MNACSLILKSIVLWNTITEIQWTSCEVEFKEGCI
jgi:hypothetical protein